MEMPQKQMDVVWKPGMVWRDPKPKGETKIYPPWKSIEEKVIEGIGLNSTESQPGWAGGTLKITLQHPRVLQGPSKPSPSSCSRGGSDPDYPTLQRQC